MARRILNRKEMRADFDAAENRKEEEERDEDEDEEGKDDEDEDEEDEEASDEEGESEPSDDEEEEEAPKKKKKPVKVAKPRTRSRTVKVVRMRVVWGVFDNSNRCVATYEYPRRKDADEHAQRLTTGPGKTHFVQPVKEPIEEKKEK